MGFFNTILEKPGIGGSPAEATKDTHRQRQRQNPQRLQRLAVRKPSRYLRSM